LVDNQVDYITLLFWKKMYSSNTLVLYSLSRPVLVRLAVVEVNIGYSRTLCHNKRGCHSTQRTRRKGCNGHNARSKRNWQNGRNQRPLLSLCFGHCCRLRQLRFCVRALFLRMLRALCYIPVPMGWMRPQAAPTFLFFFMRSTSSVTDSALKSMSPSSVS